MMLFTNWDTMALWFSQLNMAKELKQIHTNWTLPKILPAKKKNEETMSHVIQLNALINIKTIFQSRITTTTQTYNMNKQIKKCCDKQTT